MATQKQRPDSILIIGNGVFGLGTLAALLARPQYASTTFTVLAPAPQHVHSASVDSTRIIRADYSDAAYSALAADAQNHWRKDPWKQHYSESGLLLSYSPQQSQQTGNSDKDSSDTNGQNYVRASLRTVTAASAPHADAIKVFNTPFDLTRAMAVPTPALAASHASSSVTAPAKAPGSAGYINRRSGWADAGGALDALRRRIRAQAGPRVRWLDGEAVRLISVGQGRGDSPTKKRRVLGVETAAGDTILARLTILATGAWTPRLLDLRGIASCTAQCMAYVSLSEREAAKLARMPVCFNMTEGIFFFPPTRRSAGVHVAKGAEHRWEVKVARHAYGYSNPQATSFGTQSLPSEPGTPVPDKDRRELLAFLAETLPFLGVRGCAERGEREVNTRLCHYLDTADGDWLVSPHPEYEEDTLFLATGGSGHGYKFLPVLGERIADVIEHKDTDETRLWRAKWAWPQKSAEDMIWCKDGSRVGVKGLVLQDQYVANPKI